MRCFIYDYTIQPYGKPQNKTKIEANNKVLSFDSEILLKNHFYIINTAVNAVFETNSKTMIV